MNNMIAVVNVDLGPAPVANPVQAYQQPVYQQPVYQQPQPIPVGANPQPNPQYQQNPQYQPNPQFPPPVEGQFPQPGGGGGMQPPMGYQYPQPGGGGLPPPSSGGYDSIILIF